MPTTPRRRAAFRAYYDVLLDEVFDHGRTAIFPNATASAAQAIVEDLIDRALSGVAHELGAALEHAGSRLRRGIER